MVAFFEVTTEGHGAQIAVDGVPITPACLSDGEVDGEIARLKAALDGIASEFKAEARRMAAEPLIARDEG